MMKTENNIDFLNQKYSKELKSLDSLNVFFRSY